MCQLEALVSLVGYMGLVPFVDLLVQVGYAVLDTEDVHQFLREGPCDGSGYQPSRRSALAVTDIVRSGNEVRGNARLRSATVWLPVTVEFVVCHAGHVMYSCDVERMDAGRLRGSSYGKFCVAILSRST
jgi:hypothetical protein